METTTIMFCSHNIRILIDNALVFNAISIRMLNHCDLISFVVFICSSVASVERGRVSFQTSKVSHIQISNTFVFAWCAGKAVYCCACAVQ